MATVFAWVLGCVNWYTALVLLCLLVASWSYWRGRNLPPGPTFIPICGMLPPFIGEFSGEYFHSLTRPGQELLCFRIVGMPFVIINSHELARETFGKRNDVTDRPVKDFFRLTDPDYKGILISSGRHWKQTRRFTMHILRDFGMGKIKAEENICEEAAKAARAFRAEGGRPFNPVAIINMAVANIICSLVFGKRYEYDDEQFRATLDSLNGWIKEMSDPSNVIFFMPIIGNLFQNKLRLIREYYNGFSRYVQDEIEQHREQFDGSMQDYVDAYLAEMETTEDTDVFNAAELRYVLQDLFIAGSETTFTSLRWTLLLMALNPDVQARAQAELDSMIGPDRQPTMEDRKRTPYTDAVLSEIQRYMTLVPLGVAHANITQDVMIRGYTIPKGCGIAVNIHALHRDPAVWKNPNQFDPENFLDANGNVINQDKLAHFSIGRRSCAGEALARMELYIFSAAFIKDFALKLPTETTLDKLRGMNIGIAQPKPHLLIMEPRA